MTDPTPNHPPVVTETPIPKDVNPDAPVSKRVRIRKWVLRITLALAIASPLLLILAALGAKVGIWSWQFGLLTLTNTVSPILLIGTIIIGAVALLLALVIKPRKGIVVGLAAILIGAIGMLNLLSTKNKVASLPFIHDITTDTQDPPTFGAVIMAERAEVKNVNTVEYAGKRAPTSAKDADGKPVMKLVSALQTQAYPEVRTLVLNVTPDVAFTQAEQVARDMGWKIKETDVASGRIDATDTTFWYGFKDDVTIRLRTAEGDGTRVDIRSISRVGGSDIGANAARVEAFLENLSE